MKRTLTRLLTSLALTFSLSAHGSDTADFKSQADQAHELIRSARALKALRENPVSRIPPEEDREAWSKTVERGSLFPAAVSSGDGLARVAMSIGWNYGDVVIDLYEGAPVLRVHGDHDARNGSIRFTGDLEVTAEPIFATDASYGYRLRGPGIDVKIERAGLRAYNIAGSYKKAGKDKPVHLRIFLRPQQSWWEGWTVDAPGMNLLEVRSMPYGLLVKGEIHPQGAGKTELAILGACLGAVIVHP